MNRLAIAVSVLAVVGCKKSVKAADVESWMKQRMTDIGVGDTKVSCPKNIEPKKGASFDCTVEVEGKTYTVVGTITEVTKDKANFETAWKDGPNGVVIRKKLAPALEGELGKELGTTVTVGCPEPLLFLDAKRSTKCDLAVGTTKLKVVITFDDKLVPIKWETDPLTLAKAKIEGLLTPSVRETIKKPEATVDCGPDPLITRPADGVIYCTGNSGTEKAKLKVEVGEDLSIKRWEAVP